VLLPYQMSGWIADGSCWRPVLRGDWLTGAAQLNAGPDCPVAKS
jgi:hypothetical protein